MPAGKLYYKALKTLPSKFVDDETRATVWDKNMVVAVNPEYAPIKYTRQTKKWVEIEFNKGKKNE